MKDLYKILNITSSASDNEIKKSYRNLALKYHPDRNQGNKEYENIFIEINEAYQILSNPESKKKYDQNYYLNHPINITPDVFLNKFKDIRKFLFSKKRKNISSKALFTALEKLLSDNNIKYLREKGSLYINKQIIQEVLNCCSYLPHPNKEKIIRRLLLIADSNHDLLQIIDNYLNKLENKSILFKYSAKILNKIHDFFR